MNVFRPKIYVMNVNEKELSSHFTKFSFTYKEKRVTLMSVFLKFPSCFLIDHELCHCRLVCNWLVFLYLFFNIVRY